MGQTRPPQRRRLEKASTAPKLFDASGLKKLIATRMSGNSTPSPVLSVGMTKEALGVSTLVGDRDHADAEARLR